MNATKHDCFKLVQIITLKQYPFCRVPGCGMKSVAGHHLFKRSRMGTAFNPKAIFTLCQKHHDYAHALPIRFDIIAKEIIGDEYETLRKLSLMIVQFREADFLRIRETLTRLAK